MVPPGRPVPCFDPYGGATPRTTLAWSNNREILTGFMLDAIK